MPIKVTLGLLVRADKDDDGGGKIKMTGSRVTNSR